MATQGTASRMSQVHSSLSAMHELAALVREFHADVVVLVARKMPHLAEVLDLDFGKGALLISDIAIPYSHRALRGRRVAIVDDVVNVGSTIDRARAAAHACGASQVEMFSLGRKDSGNSPYDIRYVYAAAMTEREYQIHAAAVPRAIRVLAKPYDLTFPIISCRFVPPVRNGPDLLRHLVLRYGWEAVCDVTPDGGDGPLQQQRYTVDRANRQGNYKIRLYIDVRTGICNLVPMAIPTALDGENPSISSSFARSVVDIIKEAAEGAPKETHLWNGEEHVRAALFARSLELGLDCLREWSDLLAVASPDIFVRDAAACVFGPCVYSIDGAGGYSKDTYQARAPRAEKRQSPFLEKFPCDRLIEAARSRLLTDEWREASDGGTSTLNCFIAFEALFTELAAIVGANDPTKYDLTWPYSQQEVAEKPYLRLRVGPTFCDVVELLGRTLWGTAPDDKHFRHIVSELLDRAIDAGSVVPTFAYVDGAFYRVYRRGESDDKDAAVRRVQFGIYSVGKPMSITRVSKIDAILAFSRAYGGRAALRPLERGTIGALTATILDDSDIPIAAFARNTGRLRVVVESEDED